MATQPVEFVRSQVTRSHKGRVNRLKRWQSLVALFKAAKEMIAEFVGEGALKSLGQVDGVLRHCQREAEK